MPKSFDHKEKAHSEEESGVTVCVAAIAQGVVVGASDRMLTAGDIEFEPEMPKIWRLTTSIAIMTAGDSSLQTQILGRLFPVAYDLISESPDQWLRVDRVADLYSQTYGEIKSEQAERVVLAPLGLTRRTFIDEQRKMSPELVKELAIGMSRHEAVNVSALIVGVDTYPVGNQAPHVYRVSNSQVTCYDTAGFASIGMGAAHAQSQFMFAGHTPRANFSETILLALSAKKRAEVAPGVGQGTDMFTIGPIPGNLQHTHPTIVENLSRIYDESRNDVKEANHRAVERAKKFFDAITAAAERLTTDLAKQATPTTEGPPPQE